MKAIFYTLLFILFAQIFSSYNRANHYLILNGLTTTTNSKKLEQVEIKVYRKNKLIQTYYSDNNGKTNFSLDLNSNYKIIYSKKGFETKIIEVNSHLPQKAVKNYKFLYEIELNEIMPLIKKSESKVALVRYDIKDNHFYPEKTTNTTPLIVIKSCRQEKFDQN